MSKNNTIETVIGAALPHDSALKHATGEALYVDDIVEPVGTLHLAVGFASHTCGSIKKIDLTNDVNSPGVVETLIASDIPGRNDISPTGCGDDVLLAKDEIFFHSQPVFAVIAESHQEARSAARLGKIKVDEKDSILTIDKALTQESYISKQKVMEKGDWRTRLHSAPHQIEGVTETGGQDHFYLEGQISLAIPSESEEIHIYCSTQHPTEVQHTVANILGLTDRFITVEVRRMGGGFGGMILALVESTEVFPDIAFTTSSGPAILEEFL